jgi:hypothetical protein
VYLWEDQRGQILKICTKKLEVFGAGITVLTKILLYNL